MRSLIDGLKSYVHKVKSGYTLTIFTTNQLIHLCSKYGLIREAQNLFEEMPERNVFTWNAIINAHVKAQNFVRARELFDAAPQKDSVTYNSMLSGYVNCNGHENQAVEVFVAMQYESGKARIDEFTLTSMLGLTVKLGVLSYGKQLHSYMLKTGNDISSFSVSSLIDMYSKCGSFQDAWRVGSVCDCQAVDLVSKNALVAACLREGQLEMARKIFWSNPELNDAISWNTMISGYAHNGYEKEAIQLFKLMAEEGRSWNEHSYASVLTACASLKNLKLGKETHAWVLKKGAVLNPFISSGIVDVYCKCGNMKYSESVHETIEGQNPFSVTSLIVGYSAEANMLAARRLFDSLAEKNPVVWTAIMSGYLKSQQSEEVFQLFKEHREKDVRVVPDVLILVSLLGACAMHATLDPGKQTHAYLLRTGTMMDEKLANALVDMYSKCGSISYAENIFQQFESKDSILYNTMIAGYAHHGYENETLLLFREMKDRGFQPDAVTFLAILSTCRHRGLIKIGEEFFYSMTKDYNIAPDIDHYSCMIDLYGRGNQLEKAVDIMEKIPSEPDAVVLGAFVNACKMNGNAELAKTAEEALLRIEGENGARYVQFASIYASDGKWSEMGRIMKMMRGKDVKKLVGCSWVHVGNKIVYTLGGVARNIAECMSKLGAKPYLISAVGFDMAGIRRHHSIETATVCHIYDSKGEVAAGVANFEAVEKFLTTAWIQNFKCNILSAPVLLLDANLNSLVLQASCQLAAECNTPVWFEPVSVVKSRRIALVANYITFASPNENELIAMGNAVANTDIFQPIKNAEGSQKLSVETLFQRLKPAITLLLDKGVKALIVTIGSDGAFLCFRGTGSINKLGFTGNQPSPFSKQLYEAVTSKCPRDHIFNTSKRESSSNMFAVHFPTLSTSVARLTGAGDCLVGGTLVAWCAGLDVTQSLAVGIAAAKAAVEVDSNVPAEYSLAKLADDSRIIYTGARTIFCPSML
nr:putative pentatricopeptide repeat-containing protein At3g18840 [Ipomoea batatas]